MLMHYIPEVTGILEVKDDEMESISETEFKALENNLESKTDDKKNS